MTSPLKGLISDSSRYLQSFKIFLERSNANQCMQTFINDALPDILTRIVSGKSELSVIGVGSGSGELDLEMFAALHLKYPEVRVDNQVVEPSLQQIRDYRDLVSRTSGLDYISFNWNAMTANEFEQHWTENETTKTADFIHMFQMLYCVKDVEATISFYQTLLHKNGKLLISLVTSDSGWGKLGKTYGHLLFKGGINCVTSEDIKRFLDSRGVRYRTYGLPSQTDITACFTEGDEKKEMLLDFLTQIHQFSESVSPEIKTEVMEFLLRECSVETDQKVLFNYNSEVIVIDKLT